MPESPRWFTAALLKHLDENQALESSIRTPASPDADSGPTAPATLSLVLSLVDVLDSVDRLVDIAADDPQAAVWKNHLIALRRQLAAAFEQAGVMFVGEPGQQFDPTRHQAVEVVRRDDVPDYTILKVILRGCLWRAQVLRYAHVVIARPPDEKRSQQERQEL